jgi:hypothetical protein
MYDDTSVNSFLDLSAEGDDEPYPWDCDGEFSDESEDDDDGEDE